MQPTRLLKNVRVLFISLVDKAANRRQFIAKAAEAGEQVIERTVRILKTDASRRMVYGIVYAPDEVDTDGDSMTSEEIEKAAYRFMKAQRTSGVDVQHSFEPGPGYVAESWLVRKNDELFPDERAGSWAVGIKVEDEAVWEQVEAGALTGLSMGGLAQAEDLTKQVEAGAEADAGADAPATVLARIRKMLRLDEAPDDVAKAEAPEADALQPDDQGTDVATDGDATISETDESGEAPPDDTAEGLAKAADALRAVDALREVVEQQRAQLAAQSETLVKQTARLEAVERATPGRQSLLGGPDAAEAVEKSYRGVRIV